ncbi:MAG: hypothetical protein RMJ55_19620 [Roseiflexaceae bacterium]|nr:hypothetical protein [Roseiflexaceae bacterium]
MANRHVLNLDHLAATRAQEIILRIVKNKETERGKPEDKRKSELQLARETDNAVTKALGVLQEHGVYACFLYLLAKEKDLGAIIVDEMLTALQELKFGWNKPMKQGQTDLTPEVVLKHISDNVTRDLERLLLAKEVLEQTLIYARYGAKARETSES